MENHNPETCSLCNEKTFLLNKGKSNWIASVASEVALIFGDYLGDYWRVPPALLTRDQLKAIEEFEHCLYVMEKGKDYCDDWKKSLNFDPRTLEAIELFHEFSIFAQNETELVINELGDILENVKNGNRVNKDKLWEYKEMLIAYSDLKS